MKSKYDVVIVGAGPAGLMAAKVLAEGGKDVVVFEKDKVVGDKVCAGGLTPKDLEYGVPDSLFEKSFSEVVVRTDKTRAVIKDATPMVYTIDRKELGEWMHGEAKKAGAEIHTGTTVTKIGADSVFLDLHEVRYDYLIGADGSSSIVRRFLGVETDEMWAAIQYLVKGDYKDLELIFDPKRFGFTYVWIFPHDGYASIGTGIDIGRTKTMQELKKEFHAWMDEEGIDYKSGIFQSAPINYDHEGFEFGNKYLIGDAGGFTSPITAEGIYTGMLSGDEVAKKIIDPDYEMAKLKEWIRRRELQEKLLRFMEINDSASDVLMDVSVALMKNQSIGKLFKKYLL